MTRCSGGAAAESASIQKRNKYQNLLQTHLFVPVAVETMGSWSKESLDFVEELGRRLTVVTGDKRESTFLRQLLSIAVQRGNAAAFAGCLPEFAGEEDR